MQDTVVAAKDRAVAWEQELRVVLDDALERLAGEEATVAQLVKLRYFAGLTIEQTAAALGISVRTANRHWAYARAWLFRRISGEKLA